MCDVQKLLANLDPERFQAIVATSPKAFREELFRRAKIKKKTRQFAFNTASNKEKDARIQKLQTGLKEGKGPGKEAIEELVRNYLYTERALLSDALDYLGVSHENGLTESDLNFVQTFDAEQSQAFRTHLLKQHEASTVELYCLVLGVPTT